MTKPAVNPVVAVDGNVVPAQIGLGSVYQNSLAVVCVSLNAAAKAARTIDTLCGIAENKAANFAESVQINDSMAIAILRHQQAQQKASLTARNIEVLDI